MNIKTMTPFYQVETLLSQFGHVVGDARFETDDFLFDQCAGDATFYHYRTGTKVWRDVYGEYVYSSLVDLGETDLQHTLALCLQETRMILGGIR